MLKKEISPRSPQIRWGFLGSARINEKIIPHIKEHPQCLLAGQASRDAGKSRAYCEKWGFARSYPSYEALVRADDIDAIYISLPNSEHFRWAKEALIHGKHLLVEKPLVMKLAEFHELKNLAEERGLLLMEGFMYAFHEQTQKIIELVQSGNLGEAKICKASFHFVLEDTNNIRLRPEVGGGAMWDIGCYICSLMSLLWPREKIVDSKVQVRKKHGVDIFVSAVITLSNQVILNIDTSFEIPRTESLEIQATRGVLRVERPFKAQAEEVLEIVRGRDEIEKIVIRDSEDPYRKEIMAFVDILGKKRSAPELNPLGLELILTCLGEPL